MKKKIYTYLEIKEFACQINNKEIPETKEILMKQDEDGWSVAHELAYHSGTTNWSTNDKDILMLQEEDGISVAHRLAYYHPTWTTHDPEILSLYSKYWKRTVEDILVTRGKI